MEQLSTVRPLVIAGEKPGHGEDAYIAGVYQDQLCYMGVFDGCGGLGARHYGACQNHTGAWIASRTAAYAMESYILQGGFQFDDASAQALEQRVYQHLKHAKEICAGDTGIMLKGDLSRSMPTTISSIVAKSMEAGKIFCEYLWAGDSRGYLLNQAGLCQITTDDVDVNGDDAFMNMREDGRHTNEANGDRPFQMHICRVKSDTPVILINSTDGGFNYFLTPMDFEYMLLDTLQQARTTAQWKKLMYQKLEAVSGDDFTLTVGCFGFGDFASMRGYFYNRWKQLQEQYILPQQNASEEELKKLWMAYKPSYYRWS